MRWLCIAVLLVSGCVSREVTARRFEVVRVIDGDTFVVWYDGELTSCRLWGVDAPERGEAWYEEGKEALEAQVLGRVVTLRFPGKRKRDHFGRLLVEVEER